MTKISKAETERNACIGFSTILEAQAHAIKYSAAEKNYRFIIKTGDQYFSSNTDKVQ